MDQTVEPGASAGAADPAAGRPFPHPLLDALRAAPDSAAFEYGTRIVSRGEVLHLIRRLAGAMRAAGLGLGRGVAIRTAVSPEAFAAHMAAHTLGCRVIGVRPGYAPAQLRHVLATGVDALVVDQATATPELLRAAGPASVLSLGPVPAATDLLAHPDEGGPLTVAARPGDIAMLNYTSGSTGLPKACALTYRALGEHWAWQPRVWSPVATAFAEGFERYLLFGTLASMVVMEFVAPCLLGGGTAVIPAEPVGGDARPLFPYAIERHRITGTIITVPRLCRMLDILRDEAVDVSSLRAMMVSGSALPPHRLAEAVARLGPVVYPSYGTTESGNATVLTPADIAEYPERVLASVGRAHPMVEISVRDEDGREVEPGATGEIHLRSPYLMEGYQGLPEETRAVLRDGWLRTRDLGRVDGDGFVYLSGRARDIVLVNAMVVYAGPIERLLADHPDVDEAYVVGEPDEATGEAVHAFVVPASGRTPDRDALAELVRAELGADSVPRTITIVADVPVTASGKPDKRALLRSFLSNL